MNPLDFEITVDAPTPWRDRLIIALVLANVAIFSAIALDSPATAKTGRGPTNEELMATPEFKTCFDRWTSEFEPFGGFSVDCYAALAIDSCLFEVDPTSGGVDTSDSCKNELR